jgi:hypothetical protein
METLGRHAEPGLSVLSGREKMKKSGIAVPAFCLALAVLGLSGCDGMDMLKRFGKENDSGGTNSPNTTKGRLTITGIDDGIIDSGSSYSVYVCSYNAGNSYYSTYHVASGTSNSSGSSSRTFTLYGNPSYGSSSLWTESGDNYYVFLQTSSGGLLAKAGPVSFANGGGNVSFDDFELIIGLKITGIDDGQHGDYQVYVSSTSGESNYMSYLAASNTDVTFDDEEERVLLYSDGGSSLWTPSSSSSYCVFLENDSGQLVAKTNYQYFTNGGAEIDAGKLVPTGLTITDNGLLSGISVAVYVSTFPSNSDPDDSDGDVVAYSASHYFDSDEEQVSLTSTSTWSSWAGKGSYYVYLSYSDSGDQLKVTTSQIDFTWGSASVSFDSFY